jgi:hypothetical protein
MITHACFGLIVLFPSSAVDDSLILLPNTPNTKAPTAEIQKPGSIALPKKKTDEPPLKPTARPTSKS